jgi:hypothetical protein
MTKGDIFIRCGIDMIREREKRHVDKGSSPKESSVRERIPKGRYPFPLMSNGERYKH